MVVRKKQTIKSCSRVLPNCIMFTSSGSKHVDSDIYQSLLKRGFTNQLLTSYSLRLAKEYQFSAATFTAKQDSQLADFTITCRESSWHLVAERGKCKQSIKILVCQWPTSLATLTTLAHSLPHRPSRWITLTSNGLENGNSVDERLQLVGGTR